MDPVANLREQREIAARLLAIRDADEPLDSEQVDAFMRDTERLCELVQALDEWRRSGGFDPYAPAL